MIMKPGRIIGCPTISILIVLAWAGLGLASQAGAESTPAAEHLAWAKRAGGGQHDVGCSVAARADGSAWVTGWFKACAGFGAGEDGRTTLTSAGGDDIFLAQYHPDG